MWWLPEEVGFSYEVAIWNKFILNKSQFVLFFQLHLAILNKCSYKENEEQREEKTKKKKKKQI